MDIESSIFYILFIVIGGFFAFFPQKNIENILKKYPKLSYFNHPGLNIILFPILVPLKYFKFLPERSTSNLIHSWLTRVLFSVVFIIGVIELYGELRKLF